MKIIGKVKEIKELKHSKELIIEVDAFPYIDMIDELEQNQYSIEINQIKSKRSLEQNKKMWALIRDIAEHTQCGNEYDLYCQFLEIANVQFEYILVDPTIDINALKQVFRAVQFVCYTDANGITYAQYKVFIGSSKFTTKEMAELIEVILRTAYDLGLENYDYYFDILGGVTK